MRRARYERDRGRRGAEDGGQKEPIDVSARYRRCGFRRMLFEVWTARGSHTNLSLGGEDCPMAPLKLEPAFERLFDVPHARLVVNDHSQPFYLGGRDLDDRTDRRLGKMDAVA